MVMSKKEAFNWETVEDPRLGVRNVPRSTSSKLADLFNRIETQGERLNKLEERLKERGEHDILAHLQIGCGVLSSGETSLLRASKHLLSTLTSPRGIRVRLGREALIVDSGLLVCISELGAAIDKHPHA